MTASSLNYIREQQIDICKILLVIGPRQLQMMAHSGTTLIVLFYKIKSCWQRLGFGLNIVNAGASVDGVYHNIWRKVTILVLLYRCRVLSLQDYHISSNQFVF